MSLCLSIQAPPKQVPKTIESMRVKDETMVNNEDTEVRSSVNQQISSKWLRLLTVLDHLNLFFHYNLINKHCYSFAILLNSYRFCGQYFYKFSIGSYHGKDI